ACAELKLASGGSGAAMGLPENFRRRGLLQRRGGEEALPSAGGTAAVLSGSCSQATLGQIAKMKAAHSALQLDPLQLAERGDAVVSDALAWAQQSLQDGPVLIYASAPPEEVKSAQAKLDATRPAPWWSMLWRRWRADW